MFFQKFRFDPPNVIEILKLLWEAKKSKHANPNKRGLESCGMMRGFQIWSQNLNRITFDPLSGIKRTKSSKIPRFACFRQFF